MRAAHPVRALVIGAGPATVMMHLPALAALRDRGEMALSVVCDIDVQRAAEAGRKFGFLEFGGDAAGAIDRHNIDAVYVFGSAQLHYEYGMAALRAGKHVFVEKPIAPTYAMATALAEAARAAGLVAVGGHNRRFYQSLAAARARAGKAGWRSAEAVFHKAEFGRPVPFGARSWLGANGIHGLDALLFMMNGLPEQLTALAGESGAAEPSAFSAVMRWADGGQGIFLCNNNAGSRREEYVFHGLGETCSVTASGLTVERDGKSERTAFPATGDGFAAEHECFVNAIRCGVDPPHSIAALAPSLFLMELIERGYSGPVRLPGPAAANDAGPILRREKSILIARPASLQPALARLLPRYRLVSVEDIGASPGARPDVVAAILGRGSAALEPALLAKLPQLGIVGVMGLSLANHAPDALLERGVTLVNAAASYARSAAEFALGLAILARRRAFSSHALMREGGWGVTLRTPGFRSRMKRAARELRPAIKAVGLERLLLRAWRAAEPLIDVPRESSVEARDLQGASVGLIGWGGIAQCFARLLIDAGAQVLVYSENAPAEAIAGAGAVPVSLSQALACDIVSLHRGLTARTRHFLGAAELAKLRSGAVLINVARGALIEPGALLARLRRGDIFACLDTYEDEPLSRSHPLRRLPNVFLTSHIAGGSRDMHVAAAEEVVRKVADYLGGGDVESISVRQLRSMT